MAIHLLISFICVIFISLSLVVGINYTSHEPQDASSSHHNHGIYYRLLGYDELCFNRTDSSLPRERTKFNKYARRNPFQFVFDYATY